MQIYKGQEYRNFLTYYGFVALKGYLTANIYNHFMKLFCAVRIASSEKYLNMNYTLIDILLKNFVAEFKSIYGGKFMTSNSHNHIIDDVKRFGILPSISAYPFESCLGHIKSLIRPGPSALPQIAKRIIERSNILLAPKEPKRTTIHIAKSGTIKCTITFPNRNYVLCSHRFEDQWFLANGRIIKMLNTYEAQEGLPITVERLPLQSNIDYFNYLFPSSLINIYVSDVAAVCECL